MYVVSQCGRFATSIGVHTIDLFTFANHTFLSCSFIFFDITLITSHISITHPHSLSVSSLFQFLSPLACFHGTCGLHPVFSYTQTHFDDCMKGEENARDKTALTARRIYSIRGFFAAYIRYCEGAKTNKLKFSRKAHRIIDVILVVCLKLD